MALVPDSTVRLSFCLRHTGPGMLVLNSWTSQPDVQVFVVDADQVAKTLCTIYLMLPTCV